MKVFLKNKYGAMKQVKVGFSWTMLFFGFFVPLIRGDWKWTIISLLIGVFTCGIANLVLAFIYNKIYIKDLIESGWCPADGTAANVLRSKGFFFSEANNLDTVVND